MSVILSVRDKHIKNNTDEVVINTQTWKTRNVDDAISGSVVYNDDEDNRAIYGGLYTYSMIAAIEAVNPGWHVPTVAEVTTLNGYAGNGGHLKEIGYVHWDDPNTGADDLVGFTALGGGDRIGGTYANLKTQCYFLLSTMYGSNYTYYHLYNNSDAGSIFQTTTLLYVSVRLIKD